MDSVGFGKGSRKGAKAAQEGEDEEPDTKIKAIQAQIDQEVQERVREILRQQEADREKARAEEGAEGRGEDAEEIDEVAQAKAALLGDHIYRSEMKDMFLVDVPTLRSIPVWEKQRVYRKARSDKIVEDKVKKAQLSESEIEFPGVITLYEKSWLPMPSLQELSEDVDKLAIARKRYGIVDGQHRVGALRKLYHLVRVARMCLCRPVRERGVVHLLIVPCCSIAGRCVLVLLSYGRRVSTPSKLWWRCSRWITKPPYPSSSPRSTRRSL